MALTADLPISTSGKAIIPTAAGGESVLGGLANAAGGFMQSAINRGNSLRAQQKFGDEQADRAGENQAALGLAGNLGTQQVTGLDSSYLAQTHTDGTPAIDPAVIAAAGKTKTVFKAAQDGLVPQTAADISLANLISDTVRKNPAGAAATLKYFHDQGFKDPQIEAANLRFTLAQQAATNQQNLEGETMKAAVNAGYSPDLPKTELLARGSEVQSKEYDLSQATKQLAMTKDKAEIAHLTGEEQDRQAKNASTNFVGSLIARVDLGLAPAFQRFTDTVSGATGTDLDDLEKNGSVQVQNAIEGARQQTKSAALANHVSPEYLKQIDDYFDSKAKSISTIFDSNVKANADNLHSMQDKLGADAINAAPQYALFKTIVGPNAATAFLQSGDQTGLGSAATQKQLQAELKNIEFGLVNNDANTVRSSLALYNDLKTGKVSFENVPVNQARTQVGIHATAGLANARAINSGDITPGNDLLTNLDVLGHAARSIVPGTQDVRAIRTASNALFSDEYIQALLHVAKNPETAERAPNSIQLYRATAAKMFTVAQAIKAEVTTGVWSIKLKPDGSGYQAVPDRAAAAKYAEAHPAQITVSPDGIPVQVATGGVTVASMLASVPAPLQDKLFLMNRSLDAMADARLAVLDPTMHMKGNVTSLDMRRHYTQGAAMPGGSSDVTAPQTPADRAKVVQDTVDAFKTIPTQMETDPSIGNVANAHSRSEAANGPIVDEAAKNHGIPPAVGRALVRSESAFDSSADAHIHFPDSHAYGLMQLQPDTARRVGLNVEGHGVHEGKPDDRTDPRKNAEGGMTYYAQLVKKHGGDYVAAAREYKGGHISAADAAAIRAAETQEG